MSIHKDSCESFGTGLRCLFIMSKKEKMEENDVKRDKKACWG